MRESKFLLEKECFMDDICKECWNEDCKHNEELRKGKIDVCQHMHDYPELWNEDEIGERDDFE